MELIRFSDSDHASDCEDTMSTSGFAFFVNGIVITWLSQGQRVVALSLCEAGHIALTYVACQGVWRHNLLEELIKSNSLQTKSQP